MMFPIFSTLLILHIVKITTSINVVVFLPGTNDDERRLLNRLAQELAFRNHHVCAFRGIIIPEKKYLVQPRLHDVRELKLKTNLSQEIYERVRDQGNDQVFWDLEYDGSDQHMIPVWTAYANACESIIDSDLMDRLRDELYDVAVVYAGNPCHLGIVQALNMPFIYFDTQGYTQEMVMSSNLPWIPSLPLSTSKILNTTFNFFNRINQFWSLITEYTAFTNQKSLMESFSPRWNIMDAPISQLFQENRDLKKRFGDFPNVNEIKKMASAYFVNSDRSLEMNGRPEMPNLVYVGGMHIEYPRPMFAPYNTTNALSKDGVIVFSFGTVVNGTIMPVWMKRAFLKAFSRFPSYRIYWRLGSPTLGDGIEDSEIPKNINFTQFIPQNDLLAAEETVLFISNGGANSIMEAVNYGVPVLGIPLYGLNYGNLKKLESKGAAIIVHKDQISAGTIYDAMRKLLKEEKYFTNAQRLSRTFKDRPTSALETALHWVEYIGRHHGAKHTTMKKANRLFSFEYLMVDVGILLIISSIVILKFILVVCSMVGTLLGTAKAKYPKEKQTCMQEQNANGKSVTQNNGQDRNGDHKEKRSENGSKQKPRKSE